MVLFVYLWGGKGGGVKKKGRGGMEKQVTFCADIDGPFPRIASLRAVMADAADAALGTRLERLARTQADNVGHAVGERGTAERRGTIDHVGHDGSLWQGMLADGSGHRWVRQQKLTAQVGKPSTMAATRETGVISGTGAAETLGVTAARMIMRVDMATGAGPTRETRPRSRQQKPVTKPRRRKAIKLSNFILNKCWHNADG